MEALFNRFTLELTEEQADSVLFEACELLVRDFAVQHQLDTIGPDSIRDELREYGAWDESELSDDEENRLRIVWMAGGNIQEENQGED